MSEIYSESMFIDSGAHSWYNIHVLSSKKRTSKNGRELAKPPVKWSQGDFSSYDLREGTEFRKYCDNYAAFMKKMEGRDVLLANVDAISNPDLTWDIQQFFEKEHGVQPVPIVHYGTPMSYVDRYLAAGKYDLLGVGGLGQGVSRHEYFSWADEFFTHICPESNKFLPLIKTHGFAMTSWELMCRYPWYCMTEDHEVLTRRGWKKNDEVFIGEDILVYNQDGTTEWSPVLDVPQFSLNNEEIYHLSNRTMEAFVTPNHRWLVYSDHGRYRQTQKVSFKTTEEVAPPKDFKIPRRGRFIGFPKEKKYSDEMVELLAWFWTDGTYWRDPKHPTWREGIVIYQSETANFEKCKRIEKVLRKTGDKWWASRTKSDPGMVAYQTQSVVAHQILEALPEKKQIPLSFIHALTKDQLNLFIEVSILGDGYKGKLKREKSFEIAQKNGSNLEVFRIALILAGYSTSVEECPEYAPGDRMVMLRTSSVAWCYSAHTRFEKIPFSGKVWCVKVKSGAFFTRCRNRVYVTGNSVDSATWVKLSAYGWLYIPRWSETKGWRFDRPPLMVNFSHRSPRKKEKQKHYDNVVPEVRATADRWLKKLGLEQGSVDGDGEVDEFGVSSHHRARSIANLTYLKDLEESRPSYPSPLDISIVSSTTVKYTKGFGL